MTANDGSACAISSAKSPEGLTNPFNRQSAPRTFALRALRPPASGFRPWKERREVSDYPIFRKDFAFTSSGVGRLQVCWQSMLQVTMCRR